MIRFARNRLPDYGVYLITALEKLKSSSCDSCYEIPIPIKTIELFVARSCNNIEKETETQ